MGTLWGHCRAKGGCRRGVTARLGCPEHQTSIKICICSQCKLNPNVSQEDKFSKKAQALGTGRVEMI